MSEARPAVDTSLLGDIERSLADPLYANHPELVEAMRQRLAVARGEVPDAAVEVQRFNEAMFIVRRESAPGGLYADKPWLAEEAEQRARVILAKAGVPEPQPETPQERALREIDEEMPVRWIDPGFLSAIDEELRVAIEVPLGSNNLQAEMRERLEAPNQPLDRLMEIVEHYRQLGVGQAGAKGARIKELVDERRAEMGGAVYDEVIAEVKHLPGYQDSWRALSAPRLQYLAALVRYDRQRQAVRARVR